MFARHVYRRWEASHIRGELGRRRDVLCMRRRGLKSHFPNFPGPRVCVIIFLMAEFWVVANLIMTLRNGW